MYVCSDPQSDNECRLFRGRHHDVLSEHSIPHLLVYLTYRSDILPWDDEISRFHWYAQSICVKNELIIAMTHTVTVARFLGMECVRSLIARSRLSQWQSGAACDKKLSDDGSKT